MAKKLIAGILTAASILSISSVASAADLADYGTSTGQANGEYAVAASVTYGSVTAKIPSKDAFNEAFLNPYNATVKTTEPDSTDATKTVVTGKNNSPVAAGIYQIVNLDKEEGLQVIAKTKIYKATGVVIKNPETKAPFGWAEVTGNSASDYDYLTDYDKLTLKDANGKGVKDPGGAPGDDAYDKAVASLSVGADGKSTGGGESAKQGKNVAMWLVSMSESDVKTTTTVKNFESNEWTGTNQVAFDPKLEVTGILMNIGKDESTDESGTIGYFTIGGKLNKQAQDTIDEKKDTVTFNVVFKLLPVKP